jgi:hypothetical protein
VNTAHVSSHCSNFTLGQAPRRSRIPAFRLSAAADSGPTLFQEIKTMGRFDSRASKKMRQRRAQAEKKERLARRALAVRAERQGK